MKKLFTPPPPLLFSAVVEGCREGKGKGLNNGYEGNQKTETTNSSAATTENAWQPPVRKKNMVNHRSPSPRPPRMTSKQTSFILGVPPGREP
ncbi:hypothetical protein L249_0533 [Ophiocordyceps polyrhachis-furcata BCC 54312]|uniref:Uncharacterized protein n=1 Tax=Ophiocordyceps polyrhachis-furcata BCC 54312 TaxID=1330021 RepID=A0A367LC92_9HYPO|nr:hypothetical protein L249_0533 [Ophiocordyceps polyrhachis-furcata BCC 54312]